jgi:N-acyl-L-homoserine lactone synthetase
MSATTKGNTMGEGAGYFELARLRFHNGMNKAATVTDPLEYELFMGLLNLTKATGMSLEEIASRIERLHQKIDRIEKKVGSVR